MANEAFAVWARAVGFGSVMGFRATEHGAPLLARGKSIGVVDGVTAFVAQELLAPLRCAAFHFEHLAQLESFETRMRKIKRDGDLGHAFGRKPLVAEIAGGAEV